MEQQKQLEEYRAKKKREQQLNQYKNNITSIFKWKTKQNDVPESEVMLNDNSSNEQHETTTNISETPEIETSKMRTEFYILFFVLWLATYILFIKLQFGIVYLIISAIFGLFLNTRTGPKEKDAPSAYSVFNKNCESIDGTLKGEQFENEIRFGALNMH